MKDELTDSGLRYGGIAGVTLAEDSYDLGEGVELRRTFSHLFSVNMMAFARPDGPGKPHPTPFRAAEGGFSTDIEVEIYVPEQTSLGDKFDPVGTIWWIAALLRLAKYPHLSVPVLSAKPFHEMKDATDNPKLVPFEFEPRIFRSNSEVTPTLDTEVLDWVAANWARAGGQLHAHPKFQSALKAFDYAAVRGRPSSSMLAMWGGIEDIFVPPSGELRFRLAALVSSYLEPPGSSRIALYKDILKLYNERSSAAHTTRDTATEPLGKTFVLMRNLLMRMIESGSVPTQDELEGLLLGTPPTAHPSATF